MLKDNRYLRKGVLTGVLRIAQESLFSGLNNIQVSTVLDQGFSECFGFTESEVCQVLKDFELAHRETEIRAWYNGYKIGSSTLYNPWSILSVAAIRPEALESYWINTAQDKLIENLIITEHCISLEELSKLLSGDDLVKDIRPSLSLNKIDGQSIWSLLLFSGYLTFREKKSETHYILKLPNREVRFYFERIVRRWIEGPSSQAAPLLKEIMVQGDLSSFREFLKDRVLRLVGLSDTGGRSDPENFYHGLVLGLFAYGLDEIYEITSNRDAGHGRYDLQLKPRKPVAPGYIFEFKSLKKSRGQDLKSAAEEAVHQVRDKQYTVELKKAGVYPLWLVGIAFQGKKLEMQWESEQASQARVVPTSAEMLKIEKPGQSIDLPDSLYENDRDKDALPERIGDALSKAAILNNMAEVIAQRGEIERALGLWQESLALFEQIGDARGKAATLHQMAGVIALQGDVDRALALWQESLALLEQIGDVQGKAAP